MRSPVSGRNAVAFFIALVVALTRWPLRSHALFSWDSANFALALERIDIAAHRPHPPGYLGYVLAGRFLNLFFHDANAALVAWNVFATAAGTILLAALAYEASAPDRRRATSVATFLIVVTSPLIWFYSGVAEIYPSELLFAALVAFAAWRSLHGQRAALYVCILALLLTALFKVVTAVLLLPLAGYAWAHRNPERKWKATARKWTVVAVAAAVILLYLERIPAASLARRTVGSDWFLWLFLSDWRARLAVLNRHGRDTLVALTEGVGIVNALALVFWMIRDRRLPAGLGRAFAMWWFFPGLAAFLFVVIAKPGYILPILPVAILVAAGLYARLPLGVAIALIALQAIANIGHFVFVAAPIATELDVSAGGEGPRYHERPLTERMAIDLKPLAFPTLATIRRSDASVRNLVALVNISCPAGDSVLIVNEAPVDWRRASYYLRDAIVINETEEVTTQIARDTEPAVIPQSGVELQTSCPVIRVSPDDGVGGVTPPARFDKRIPNLAWLTPGGTLRVTPAGVELIQK